MSERSIGRLPQDREAGMFIVLWGLLIVALFTMVAVVVDLGAVRQDRRSNRAAADSAATAGAFTFGTNTSTPLDACNAAWSYAMVDLGLSGTSPCESGPTPFGSTCSESSVTGSVGDYEITIVNPVLDTDTAFLNADSMGGDRSQAVSPVDGVPCDRVGVRIRQLRKSFFAGIVGSNNITTDVHSVALYKRTVGPGADIPALVALEPHKCPSIDAKNGLIRAFANPIVPNKPGLIYADSDGTGAGCNPDGTVFSLGNPGRIWADPSTDLGTLGELGYVAPVDHAFSPETNPSLPNYKGRKLRLPEPVTRKPVDQEYHCSNVTPLPDDCTTATDYIPDLESRYGAGIPVGFTVWGDEPSESCSPGSMAFPAPDLGWYISCLTFTVKDALISFPRSDIIFSGNIALDSNGTLDINTQNVADATVVVRGTGGVSTKSNNWRIHWYRTFVMMYNAACTDANRAPCGTMVIDNGEGSWTAPASDTNGFKNLLYWSETTQPHTFKGNPEFSWAGIFFAGNSLFDLQGDVLVNATDVQLWVNSVQVGNRAAELRMSPDPNKALSTTKPGTALIR